MDLAESTKLIKKRISYCLAPSMFLIEEKNVNSLKSSTKELGCCRSMKVAIKAHNPGHTYHSGSKILKP